MSDHYQVLGVERDATQEIISSAYRALVKAFHPDVFKGDRGYAESRLKAVNAAFDVIGDPDRRQGYDNERRLDSKTTASDRGSWKRACDFFPTLSAMESDLALISEELSATFREFLLERRAFKEAEAVRDRLVRDFSTKRFGENDQLQKAGLTSLRMGRRSFAVSINQACNLIGDDDPDVILKRLAKDHPEDAMSVYLACDLDRYLPKVKNPSFRPGLYKIGSGLRFRILPDASVMVFYANGHELEDYRHVPSLKGLLVIYQETESAIEPMDGDK
jgi:curved DNA-binding protein CbpA